MMGLEVEGRSKSESGSWTSRPDSSVSERESEIESGLVSEVTGISICWETAVGLGGRSTWEPLEVDLLRDRLPVVVPLV